MITYLHVSVIKAVIIVPILSVSWLVFGEVNRKEVYELWQEPMVVVTSIFD